MATPHPLTSLYAAGPEFAEEAKRRLRAALAEHNGDVRATAAALVPPVHEVTLHKWMTRWGMRRPDEIDQPADESSC